MNRLLTSSGISPSCPPTTSSRPLTSSSSFPARTYSPWRSYYQDLSSAPSYIFFVSPVCVRMCYLFGIAVRRVRCVLSRTIRVEQVGRDVGIEGGEFRVGAEGGGG